MMLAACRCAGSYSCIRKLLLAGGTDADWQRAPWKTMGNGNRNKRRQGKQPAGREQLREEAASRSTIGKQLPAGSTIGKQQMLTATLTGRIT